LNDFITMLCNCPSLFALIMKIFKDMGQKKKISSPERIFFLIYLFNIKNRPVHVCERRASELNLKTSRINPPRENPNLCTMLKKIYGRILLFRVNLSKFAINFWVNFFRTFLKATGAHFCVLTHFVNDLCRDYNSNASKLCENFTSTRAIKSLY
jgi:hypothetical protein